MSRPNVFEYATSELSQKTRKLPHQFGSYLLSASEQVNAYKTERISTWGGWFAWQGFFQYLQTIPDKLKDGSWGYVSTSNRRGHSHESNF